jgi:hypothetical protein
MIDWISFSRRDESLAEKIPLIFEVIVFLKISNSSYNPRKYSGRNRRLSPEAMTC